MKTNVYKEVLINGFMGEVVMEVSNIVWGMFLVCLFLSVISVLVNHFFLSCLFLVLSGIYFIKLCEDEKNERKSKNTRRS